MAGKKLQLARLLMALRVHSLVGRNEPATLLVLNYHRLRGPGRSVSSRFDDGVVDTDFGTFLRQMRWLKAATQVLDEEALLQLGSDGELPSGRLCSAVTFDDGYIDCYALVKPVLDELGIRGIFFIPVEMIETRRLGWWDIAAYLLKKTERRSIVVDGLAYDLAGNFTASLKRVLNLFKLESASRSEGLLEKLSEACGIDPPGQDVQSAELMTWAQVRELRAAGHSIGSHAMSHRVLATLDPDVQRREIFDSRRELEAIVGCSVSSFAYPVGGPKHFNQHSVDYVREAGYEQAFTFNTGLTSLPVSDRFQIPRESAPSLTSLKAKALLPRLMGMEIRPAA
jgi:peptidoglycan/xylan/chitin deacetylase (PgdA/CDA1 family)